MVSNLIGISELVIIGRTLHHLRDFLHQTFLNQPIQDRGRDLQPFNDQALFEWFDLVTQKLIGDRLLSSSLVQLFKGIQVERQLYDDLLLELLPHTLPHSRRDERLEQGLVAGTVVVMHPVEQSRAFRSQSWVRHHQLSDLLELLWGKLRLLRKLHDHTQFLTVANGNPYETAQL